MSIKQLGTSFLERIDNYLAYYLTNRPGRLVELYGRERRKFMCDVAVIHQVPVQEIAVVDYVGYGEHLVVSRRRFTDGDNNFEFLHSSTIYRRAWKRYICIRVAYRVARVETFDHEIAG